MSITTTPLAARNADGLAIIGRTLHDLRSIRFDEGEGGNAPAGAGGDQAAIAAAGAAAGAAGAQQPSTESKPPWGDDPSKFDPDKAWKLIQNVKGDVEAEKSKREQAIKEAVAQAQKDIVAQIGKGLGFGQQEQETDPVKLAASLAERSTALTTAQAAVKSGQVATQVAILAPGLGASARLLLNNEAFKSSIASVEPTDEAALTSAITKALQANAALKATPSHSGSGEHTGAMVQTLEAQLRAATEKKDFVETIRLKQAIAAARKA